MWARCIFGEGWVFMVVYGLCGLGRASFNKLNCENDWPGVIVIYLLKLCAGTCLVLSFAHSAANCESYFDNVSHHSIRR